MSATTNRMAPAAAHAPQLLAELKLAHRIIAAMLGAMTSQQKARVHAELDAAGVCGEGMTRANERLAVIEVATAAASSPAPRAATGPDHQPPAAPEREISVLEDRFEQFPESLMAAHAGAAPLMQDLNKMATICAGLGAVLRIVASNVVLQDNFVPNDPDAAVPLSQAAVCNLTSMAAAMCEQLNENVVERADWYKSKVAA